jgi:excisionase family DNA binding protein
MGRKGRSARKAKVARQRASATAGSNAVRAKGSPHDACARLRELPTARDEAQEAVDLEVARLRAWVSVGCRSPRRSGLAHSAPASATGELPPPEWSFHCPVTETRLPSATGALDLVRRNTRTALGGQASRQPPRWTVMDDSTITPRTTAMPGRTVAPRTSGPPQQAPHLGTAAVPERMLLTVEEAADVLCVGRSLMYELIGRGAIRAVRIGRLRRIRPEAPAEYIASLSEEAQDIA